VADLNSKVVIVTGASSGIGAALAQGFSKEGARVTLPTIKEVKTYEKQKHLWPNKAL